MAALVDTNILVYRFDFREPEKRQRAHRLFREGLADRSLRIPHQAVIEFISVATRRLPDGDTLLTPAQAWDEADQLLTQFEVLYPNDDVVRTAIRGAAVYRLPWYDAHLWAYAECNGLEEILSEDFQHGRLYGTVRIVNPFR